ncbi:MAG TPA: hypothetical protein VFY06_10780 [Verrucomicrobiae bacterium]|nr:hypothetical protein [Verrucomicrobiae bacterium]
MRHLLQPRVLYVAVIAALISALASYPRMSLWLNRSDPVWYLEGVIFLCGIVLWGFVFAWHTPYTGKPVFTLKLERGPFLAATAVAIVAATMFGLLLDPSLRPRIPEEYPADLKHWFAMLLFSLAINQLILIFAPFDWLMRLSKRRWVAINLTVLFGAFVLALKIHALSTPLPPLAFAALVLVRIVTGFLAVFFYLRGGVVLVWWWTFLFEARHLLTLTVHS